MNPRPETVWTLVALAALACVAAAGFMVGPKCGLWCTGVALFYVVRLGGMRRD